MGLVRGLLQFEMGQNSGKGFILMVFDFWKIMFEKSSLKNQVWKTKLEKPSLKNQFKKKQV